MVVKCLWTNIYICYCTAWFIQSGFRCWILYYSILVKELLALYGFMGVSFVFHGGGRMIWGHIVWFVGVGGIMWAHYTWGFGSMLLNCCSSLCCCTLRNISWSLWYLGVWGWCLCCEMFHEWKFKNSKTVRLNCQVLCHLWQTACFILIIVIHQIWIFKMH